ncbi:coiled-coil domain-containing protein 142 isoform X2 [Chrysemys picta bellii]|uniref:coiled-coil domain-containing protein 142 isoform X2 n=2 Tax=Chrysemys picta bellii TaxID=8478 RepID=UPI0032B25B2D
MDKESSLERSRRKAYLEMIEVDGIGLNAVFILIMSRMSQASGSILPPLSSLVGPKKVSPTDGQREREESADSGCSSLSGFAKSLQKAEALLWNCVNPSVRRLLQQQASASAYDSDEEDSPGALARLAQVERSYLGLSRCLCVQENPRTETFRGHVKPAASDTAQGAFSYHPVYPRVAKHCATLHALLQHRHRLRLSHEYSRRLKGASDFVRHLLALLARKDPGGDPGGGGQLRGLCEELRTHTSHWSGLQRKMRSDPWLRVLLLQHHESVTHMKQALGLLALHAIRLVERYVEVLLHCLARASPAAVSPAQLSDLFQGLEIYNHVLSDRALERASSEPGADPATPLRRKGEVCGGAQAYPIGRVLGVLAAERGRLAAHRLHQLLLQRAQRDCLEQVHWENAVVPWSMDRSSISETDVGSPGPPTVEGLPSLPKELQVLCREDKELLDLVLGVLVASTDTLWHHVLKRPKQEKPPAEEGQEPPLVPAASPGLDERLSSASLPSWKSVRWLDASYSEAAEVLYAQYRPLFWEAAATSLAHRLELRQDQAQPCGGLPPCTERAAAALAQELSQALGQARVPLECEAALRRLCMCLISQAVFQSWDRGFCQALGSSLSDKCMPGPRTAGTAHSRTAQLLRELHPPLAFALKCLEPPLAARTASGDLVSPSLRLELLTRCLATGQASCSWLMAKAYQHLAAWSLCPFLLVTQGDLQLLKAETTRLAELVSGAFPEGEESPRWVRPALGSHQERQLCLQIYSTATSIQSFSQDVLRMFSSDCKRMSAEIFSQTMPLGKHWRAGLRADLPSTPSEYALAAAQSVLGQVLQGIQLLPHESQVPALTHVMTAFVEAWMDHILTQKIKFSLQGALQLKQDFDTVRQLVQSEDCGLSPEIKQSVLSLRIFQQMDNAIICLLQQPSSKAYLPSHTWESFRKCCSHNGVRTQDFPSGSLNSLESLDVQALRNSTALETQSSDLLSQLQGSCTPESYLPSTQQEWLSLRLHGTRRWKVPSLPCTKSSEP